MPNIVDLDRAIAKVCPIHGVAVGRWEDRDTWRIDFKDEATSEQRVAAMRVLQEFDPDAKPVVVSSGTTKNGGVSVIA